VATPDPSAVTGPCSPLILSRTRVGGHVSGPVRETVWLHRAQLGRQFLQASRRIDQADTGLVVGLIYDARKVPLERC